MALRMVALVRAKDRSWFARKGIRKTYATHTLGSLAFPGKPI